MRKFKVNVLRVQGKNNKTYKANAEVTEDCFPDGNADKLVADGKLIEITSKKVTPDPPVSESKKEDKKESGSSSKKSDKKGK